MSPSLASGAPLAATPDLFVSSSSINCQAADGSAASPFCTIGEALAAAPSGELIRIAPGTYTEQLVLNQDVTLLADSGAAVTIVDGGMAGPVLTIAVGVDATVEGLTITGGAGQNPGVMVEGSGVLRDLIITGNQVTFGSGAGGVRHMMGAGALLIDRCTISANGVSAPGSSEAGGVFGESTNALEIRNSTISDNVGTCSGGVACVGADLIITGTTISGNQGNPVFGAIDSLSSACLVVNSTVSDNDSVGISFLANGNGTTFVRGVTVAGNTQRGISNVIATLPEISNTIVAGNGSDDYTGLVLSLGFNLIGNADQSSGFGAQDLLGSAAMPMNPQLGPLAANGGFTETRALLAGSPAIGAGDQVTFEPMDQRGLVRASGQVDIGAFESGGASIGSTVPGCVGLVNSAGLIGETKALGSTVTAMNDFGLRAVNLPPGRLAIFVASRTPGFSPVGSGNLCLSGIIGRLNGPGQIQTVGPGGAFNLTLDLTRIPLGSNLATVMPGDTWYFQTWHQDGTNSSNFATAIQVTFS